MSVASALGALEKLDYTVTKTVYNALNSNKYMASLPYWLGLLPYEMYVLPGMFVAMIAMVWTNSFHPAQFHLLPHWFAFSLATYIKHNVHRVRPGCVRRGMKSKISSNHCSGSTRRQSFPSGHTIIASALATSLMMYLDDPTYSNDEKVFAGIPFYDSRVRNSTKAVAIIVVVMIAFHRISFGYHYVGDVAVGGILGYLVGLVSYRSFDAARRQCRQQEATTTVGFRTAQVVVVAISAIAIYDFFKNKLWKLSELKH